MRERWPDRLASVLLALAISILLVAQTAGAYTIILGGQVSSRGTMTITQTITVDNLANPPQDAYLTFNAPVFDNFADDGFAQTIAWRPHEVSPAPASATEFHDTAGDLDIRYIQYRWPLNNVSGTFTVTVKSNFDFATTADPRPYAFTDTFSSPGGVTAGATTRAEAVDKISNYVKLNDPGNCVARANLMLSRLQSAGIRARVVQGMAIDQAYSTDVFYIDDAGYQLFRNWGKEYHVWVEVYYPDEGRWVPYDPAVTKGFVDQRHIAMGISPATECALNQVSVYANKGVSPPDLHMAVSYSLQPDTGSYEYRYYDTEPAALDIPNALLGRDMVNAPTPTPTPTPGPTPTPAPVPTPIANATVTPKPGATMTPSATPFANVTITPSPAPSDVIRNEADATAATGAEPDNATGTVTVTPGPAAPATGDGQPWCPLPCFEAVSIFCCALIIAVYRYGRA